MDANGDGELSAKEILVWDMGYLHFAQTKGLEKEYDAAKKEAEKSRDLNGDGVLTHDEFSTAALYDFYRADVNKDRFLSKEELLNNYETLKTFRNVVQ